MSTTNALPSIRQMAVRSNSGHAKALRCLADGTPLVREGAFASEIRGMRTILGTLRRWECVDTEGWLTQRGRDLLAHLDSA